MRRLIAAALAAAMMLAPQVRAAEEYADVWFGSETDDKRIALTFDDGPHPRYTAEILDILAEYDIPATFFIVGDLARQYPALILRELAGGHELGSHTWSHPHIRNVTEAALREELAGTEELLLELADYRPQLFRPPEGACDDLVRRVAGAMDYDVVLWTVDTRDWSRPPSAEIVENVLTNTREGAIILCHDFVGGESQTPAALREFIPALLAAGYEFVTVSELIGG